MDLTTEPLHVFSAENFHACCEWLAARDADLNRILQTHGYPPMWSRGNSFESLVHIILEQQVSLASALAALNKLGEKLGTITAGSVLRLDDEAMRACFVSRQKAGYIRGLAQALQDGDLDLEALATMPDDAVRARLVQLKGIGNWTVDVYLMFVLRRADIFPAGDLAAVNALKRLKQLPPGTSGEHILELSSEWRPYRSIATMMLWHYYLSDPERRPKKLVRD